MKQRHKHADVIIAWAEGAEIEYRDTPTSRWKKSSNPGWYENYEYRIKLITDKYRVAMLFNDDNEPYTISVDSQDYADIIEQRGDFGRWLTDWIE